MGDGRGLEHDLPLMLERKSRHFHLQFFLSERNDAQAPKLWGEAVVWTHAGLHDVSGVEKKSIKRNAEAESCDQ